MAVDGALRLRDIVWFAGPDQLIKCDALCNTTIKIVVFLPCPCLVDRRAHIANLNLGINARDSSRTRAGLAGEKKSMIF